MFAMKLTHCKSSRTQSFLTRRALFGFGGGMRPKFSHTYLRGNLFFDMSFFSSVVIAVCKSESTSPGSIKTAVSNVWMTPSCLTSFSVKPTNGPSMTSIFENLYWKAGMRGSAVVAETIVNPRKTRK